MKANEKLAIYKEVAEMTDEELEMQAHYAVMDALGSQVEEMIELDFDSEDIKAQRKLERYLADKANIFIDCCDKRHIELFKEDDD